MFLTQPSAKKTKVLSNNRFRFLMLHMVKILKMRFIKIQIKFWSYINIKRDKLRIHVSLTNESDVFDNPESIDNVYNFFPAFFYVLTFLFFKLHQIQYHYLFDYSIIMRFLKDVRYLKISVLNLTSDLLFVSILKI